MLSVVFVLHFAVWNGCRLRRPQISGKNQAMNPFFFATIFFLGRRKRRSAVHRFRCAFLFAASNRLVVDSVSFGLS